MCLLVVGSLVFAVWVEMRCPGSSFLALFFASSVVGRSCSCACVDLTRPLDAAPVGVRTSFKCCLGVQSRLSCATSPPAIAVLRGRAACAGQDAMFVLIVRPHAQFYARLYTIRPTDTPFVPRVIFSLSCCVRTSLAHSGMRTILDCVSGWSDGGRRFSLPNVSSRRDGQWFGTL